MAKDTQLTKLMSAIKAVGESAVKVRDTVQTLATQAAFYAYEHNNAQPLTELAYQISGTGLNMDVFVRWCEQIMPVLWRHPKNEAGEPDTSKLRVFGIVKSHDKIYNPEAIAESPWWAKNKKSQNVATEYDVAEAVRELIKRAQREVASGKKAVINEAAILELEKVVAKFGEVAATESNA